MMIFILLVLLVAAILAYRMWSKRQMRLFLLETILSDAERKIVSAQVPLTDRLPAQYRLAFEGKMALFLHQVTFIGCNGLEVTEEMALSIAAQACLLVVNSDTWYDHLTTVLIYPSAFKSRGKRFNKGVVTERDEIRLGESWSRGPVILSWAHSTQGAANAGDGHNVVLHEFAHQIDDLSGHTDGAPLMNKGQSFGEWSDVFIDAFARHREHVEAGRKTVIDPYGAEGPEEYFAVAVEVFFEKAPQLKREEPEVYAQLAQLLQIDPATWSEPNEPALR